MQDYFRDVLIVNRVKYLVSKIHQQKAYLRPNIFTQVLTQNLLASGGSSLILVDGGTINIV